MNFIDLFTFTFFLTNLGIALAKLFNISKLANFYDFRLIFLTMIVSFFAWLINLGTLSASVNLSTEILRMQTFIFRISTFLLALNAFLTVIEIIVALSSYSVGLLRRRRR